MDVMKLSLDSRPCLKEAVSNTWASKFRLSLGTTTLCVNMSHCYNKWDINKTVMIYSHLEVHQDLKYICALKMFNLIQHL